MSNQHAVQAWWQPIHKILNQRRLSYGFFTGAALWLAWLVSISLGPENLDLAKQVIGTDYIQFYASGLTLQKGESDLLYDFNYQSQLEVEIAGPELINYHAFLTPPIFAWLFVPFSYMPYSWSFFTWSILNLLGLYACMKMLGVEKTKHTYIWTLCWFPIFAAISFGQNSLLTILLMTITFYLWKKQYNYSAGLIASLVLYKPQLLIGIAILWLIRWRKDWKALLGLVTGAAILGGISYLFLPEAVADYLKLAINFIPDMIYQDQFPLYHLHALRGFWILLLPGKEWIAETLSILISLAGIVCFILFVRRNHSRPYINFALAIALTIFITPHAMIYDWALLIIPAILLYQEMPDLKPYWKVIFTCIWLVTLVSGPLTYLQQKFMPFALQLSVPVYLIVLFSISRTLLPRTETHDADLTQSPSIS